MDNIIIDQDFKEKMDKIEKEMDSYNIDIDTISSERNISDSFKMYLQEICMYPLLTIEEEQEYGKIIQSPDKVKLLLVSDVDNITTYTLNREQLFSSLVNTSIYTYAIDSILNLYSKINCHENGTENDLMKYKKLSTSFKRALNENELKEYFNYDVNNRINNETEVLCDVKNFIEFKFAFDKFFKSNLRLVVSVAKKYYSNVDPLELISEGNMGLLKAMQKFNPSLGYKFSTYAVYWISQSIERAIMKYNLSVRLPESFYRKVRKFKKDVEELEKKEERELSDIEISEKLNIPIEKINEYKRSMFEMISLYKPVSDDSDISIIDTIAINDDLDDIVFAKTLKEDIEVLLNCLTEREKKVIKMRFGMESENRVRISFLEIAKELSVSVERVRQIEMKALVKMKRIGKTNAVKSLKYYM